MRLINAKEKKMPLLCVQFIIAFKIFPHLFHFPLLYTLQKGLSLFFSLNLYIYFSKSFYGKWQADYSSTKKTINVVAQLKSH